jgi:hypothetical protein
MLKLSQMLLGGQAAWQGFSPAHQTTPVRYAHESSARVSNPLQSLEKLGKIIQRRSGARRCASTFAAQPSERQQRHLSKAETNKLRKASQQLGKDICTLNI